MAQQALEADRRLEAGEITHLNINTLSSKLSNSSNLSLSISAVDVFTLNEPDTRSTTIH